MNSIIDFKLLSISHNETNVNLYFEVSDRDSQTIKKNYLEIIKLQKRIEDLNNQIIIGKNNNKAFTQNNHGQLTESGQNLSITKQLNSVKNELNTLTKANETLIAKRDLFLEGMKNDFEYSDLAFYQGVISTPHAKCSNHDDGEFFFKYEPTPENQNLTLDSKNFDKQREKHILRFNASNSNNMKLLGNFLKISNIKITEASEQSSDRFHVSGIIDSSVLTKTSKADFINKFNSIDYKDRIEMFNNAYNQCKDKIEDAVDTKIRNFKRKIRDFKQDLDIFDKFFSLFLENYVKQKSDDFIKKISDNNGQFKSPCHLNEKREIIYDSSINLDKLEEEIYRENYVESTSKLVLHEIYSKAKSKNFI